MLGFLIIGVLVMLAIIYFANNFEELGVTLVTILICAFIFNGLFILSNVNKHHYNNEIWKDIDDFDKLPVKYQIDIIDKAKGYEYWRQKNKSNLNNEFLYDWYFDDDAQDAPVINIDSLYKRMEIEN